MKNNSLSAAQSVAGAVAGLGIIASTLVAAGSLFFAGAATVASFNAPPTAHEEYVKEARDAAGAAAVLFAIAMGCNGLLIAALRRPVIR